MCRGGFYVKKLGCYRLIFDLETRDLLRNPVSGIDNSYKPAPERDLTARNTLWRTISYFKGLATATGISCIRIQKLKAGLD